jgi:amino-acid N-acetyltransferase
MIAIEPANAADRAAIESLLLENGLPVAGLEDALATAVVAREDGRLVGCAAVEVYEPSGLLRSVCVEASHRSTGLGRRLVECVEIEARRRGVDELFLLTETAAEWFPRLGFRPDARDAAPAPIQLSAEFAGACPVSAVLLRKRLEPAAAVS